MNASLRELECRVESLLADAANLEHPLGRTLREVWQHMSERVDRLEKVTLLSDAFQSMARERERGICERFEHQLQRIDRMMRISDRYQSMLLETNTALLESSNLDPLTGVNNRRALSEALQREIEAANGSGKPLTVAMLDIDRFKAINDEYGHQTGDDALVEIARILCAGLRNHDTCGRWGGEEFIAILPDTDLEQARVLLETRLEHFKSRPIVTRRAVLALTFSTGVAQYRPGRPMCELLSEVDSALYLAKRQGRNQVVLHTAHRGQASA